MKPAGLVLALLLLAARPAWAQAPAPLDGPGRAAAVQAAAKALRERYVYPQVGAQAAARIEAKLAAGAYDGAADRIAFADRLTEDLAQVAHDKHMRVTAAGGPPPAAIAKMGPPPRSEFGVVRADRLAGGVGYVEVNGFLPMEVFAPAIDRAMAALAGSKTVIVDLRRNGGGSPASVAYLASFFFEDARPLHLNDLIWRNPGTDTFRTEVFQTTPTPTKFTDASVILLTSAATFSGGEEFAYDLQTQKRATLVGELTGGGANPGGTLPLGSGLTIFIPAGRAANPVTRTSWEGRGVAPDLAIRQEDALQAALEHLGAHPASGAIEALSQARVFTPHATPTPASEAAARRWLDEAATQQFRYDLMSDQLAAETRDRLPKLKAQLAALGAVRTVAFREVSPIGADVYDVTFANGSARLMMVVSTDGKTTLLASLSAAPRP